MTNVSKIYLSWQDIETDCRKLCAHITAHNFKAVLGIARGGVVPSLIITKMLDILIYDIIGIAAYDGCQQKDNISLLKPASDEIETHCPNGKGLLIVDDLVDTGRTIEFVKNIYPEAYIAVPYTKPLGEPYADIFIKSFQQNEWLVFPWEHYQDDPE